MDRFEMGSIIGQGSYAVVKKARDLLENRIVAIKIYEKYRLIDSQKRNNVKRERIILQKLSHPHIITLLLTVDTQYSLNLVMQYILGSMSLRDFLKAQAGKKLSDAQAQYIFKYHHTDSVSQPFLTLLLIPTGRSSPRWTTAIH